MPVEIIEDNDDRLIQLVRKPVGVVAAISPWNAPLLIMAEKVFSALAVGNTVVAKPSPYTPLGTLKMAEIWKDLLPPGVLNVLAGGDDLGAALVNHPGTNMISFTGSVSAGKSIAEAAGRADEAGGVRARRQRRGHRAARRRRQGGRAADFGAAFQLGGQACAAIKRVYADRSIYQALVDELAAWATLAKAAPAADGGTFGPLVTRPQFERVSELVSDALAHGAKAASGGAPVAGNGFYFPPTILTGAGPGVRVVDEEQFGPVLPVIPFDDVEDAIAAGECHRVRPVRVGLDRRHRAWAGTRGPAAGGTTWVNSHTEVAPHIPFGGVKDSGLGRAWRAPRASTPTPTCRRRSSTRTRTGYARSAFAAVTRRL